MILGKILNSATALSKLTGASLGAKTAYKVYVLAKQINEHRDFFINEEKKLINLYAEEIKEETGEIFIYNEERRAEFMQKREELYSMEIELAPLKVSLDELGDIKLTPIDFISLEGIIDFN